MPNRYVWYIYQMLLTTVVLSVWWPWYFALYITTGDFVVKETPVKKQVDDYRRYKLQRLRYANSYIV